MVDKKVVEDYIKKLDIPETKKKAILKRLQGIVHDGEQLGPDQLDSIFEGIRDLRPH